MNLNRKQFTLIELVVILSIISILTAFVIPALNRAQKELEKINCLNNQSQLGLGFISYTVDNNGFMPNSWYHVNNTRGRRMLNSHRFKVYNDFYGVGETLYKALYVGDEHAFQCSGRTEYGPFPSFDKLTAWREFADMDYADKYVGDKWLCSSYMFKIYEWEQIQDSPLLSDKVNNEVSYRLNYPDRPMASDNFVKSSFFGSTGFSHDGGHNVLYQDGSASFIEDDTLYCSWYSWEVRDLFKAMRR